MGQVVTVLRHRYGAKAEAISIQMPDDLPPAHCEPTHLNQVLTNLVGNALEYTEGPVRVWAAQRDGWLEVKVSDRGTGLPPDRIEFLFKKGGPAGRNRARGGLGIGLYLCRLVVEKSFGGSISLDGTGRSGTTFRFTVPAVRLLPAAASAAVSS